MSLNEKLIKGELEDLKKSVHDVVVEIASMKHPTAEDDRLITATQELNAIVVATESATEGILGIAEKISNMAIEIEQESSEPHISSKAGDISSVATSLFEACTFQDITGQRVQKVVNTLSYIEERITRIIGIIGAQHFEHVSVEEHLDEEEKLLNGPQLENRGVDQSDIDALFG